MSTQNSIKAGVMGWPIGHSLSPRLHGYWLQHYGLNGTYEALEVCPEELALSLRGLNDGGFAGVNLTIPHKVAACEIVDELGPMAQRIGAVNLVTLGEQGRLIGQNTDAYGFEQNLKASGFQIRKGTAFVLGAGGACRAVLVALQNMKFNQIQIANRTEETAMELASELATEACEIRVVNWEFASNKLSDLDLFVNTTSLGMIGQPPLEVSLENFPVEASIADIVYAPLETNLLKEAKKRGHPAIDGLGMLLHQARPSFKAFFGIDPAVTEDLRRFVLNKRDEKNPE